MREIISLNENWTLSFPKGDHATEQVNLPHTWNAVDGPIDMHAHNRGF